MKEWIKHTSGYWGFGSFIIALLVLLGSAGYWALGVQEDKLENRVSQIEKSVSTTISTFKGEVEAELAAVEETAAITVAAIETEMSADILIVEGKADTNRDLISRLGTKLDRMDAKLDTLLIRLPPSSN